MVQSYSSQYLCGVAYILDWYNQESHAYLASTLAIKYLINDLVLRPLTEAWDWVICVRLHIGTDSRIGPKTGLQ